MQAIKLARDQSLLRRALDLSPHYKRANGPIFYQQAESALFDCDWFCRTSVWQTLSAQVLYQYETSKYTYTSNETAERSQAL